MSIASSYLPFDTNHLGDSGTLKSNSKNKRAIGISVPNIPRHNSSTNNQLNNPEGSLDITPAALPAWFKTIQSTKKAKRIPKVMES